MVSAPPNATSLALLCSRSGPGRTMACGDLPAAPSPPMPIGVGRAGYQLARAADPPASR
jgi:hypothetical protein